MSRAGAPELTREATHQFRLCTGGPTVAPGPTL